MKDRFPASKLLPMLSPEAREHIAEVIEKPEDGEIIRKGIVQQPSILPDERAVMRYISTREIDRDSEILVPDGAMIEDYKRNPVVLFGHNYSNPPHAKAASIEIDDYGIKSKTVYAQTPRAEEIWQLVSGGFLQAASVGFMPVESVENGGPGWSEVTKKLGKKWALPPEHFAPVKAIYTKWLLLEYSDVPVPSNPTALLLQAKSLGISDETLTTLGIEVNEPIEKPKVSIARPNITIIPVVHPIPRVHPLPQVTVAEAVKEAMATIRGKV